MDLSRDLLLRWDAPEARHVPLIKECGATVVLPSAPDAAFESACRQAKLECVSPAALRFAKLADLDHQPAGAPVVLADGLWPGVSRGGDVVIATATQKPWINANGYLVRYLRALYPDRPAVLGYLPNEAAGLRTGSVVPFDTLELALIEARVFGGNYVLAVEPGYRAALLAGEERALAAWKRLGRTARWLAENAALFSQPALPAVTALMDQTEACAELANLLFRHGASPALAPASNPPPPDRTPRTLLAAVNIAAPPAEARRCILAHADTGATVVVDAPGERAWWRSGALKLLRRQEDRDFYALGRGRIVAYKEPVLDPSSFASDVIDLITPQRRPVRVWAVYAGIILGTAAPAGTGSVLLHIVNYGAWTNRDAMAQVRGAFTRARLLRPDREAVELKPIRRGPMTEVMLPDLGRLGVIAFG